MHILKSILLTILLILIQTVLYIGVLYFTNNFDFLEINAFRHATGLLTIFLTITSYILIFLFFWKPKIKAYNSRKTININVVGLLLIIVFGLELIKRPFFDFQKMISYFEFNTIENYTYNYSFFHNYRFFSSLILAPILEELFFRKYLLIKLLKKNSIIISLLVSSSCFSFIHIDNPKNLIPTFIFGYISGFIYLKSKNILYSIIFHFLSNLLWVLLLLKGKMYYDWLYDFNFGIEFWLLFAIGIILTIFGVHKIRNHFNKKSYV